MLYHGEHGRLQGTQGTHKYILTILCLVLGHVIMEIMENSWTSHVTRNSRNTHTVHINYLVFGARPCYIMENMDAYKELKAHTSTCISTILCFVLGHVISWRTWTPTRNSRHTQVHINYLMFGARPCYIMENMDAYKELKAHTSTY